MKDNFKVGLKLTGKMIIAGILSFFVCISIQFLCINAFTEEAGYYAYGYEKGQSDEDIELLYTHLYSNGDDTQWDEYEQKEYTLIKKTFRSDLAGKGQIIFYSVSQAITLIMLISFVSGQVYKIGNQDSNKFKFGRINKDILKGFKIGLFANGLAIVCYIVLLIFKGNLLKEMPVSIYALLNCPFFPAINSIAGKGALAVSLTAGKMFGIGALLLAVPVITGIAYLLGFKGINPYERFVYKKQNKG